MEEVQNLDAAMQERLHTLLEHFSQSEIARRTGFSKANVNHYLGRSRVPASFCSALVTKLGVNPMWLLTGEGNCLQSEVSANASHIAEDLLELVTAMNSVLTMRLGSLGGGTPQRILRDLHDGIERHAKLRKRMGSHMSPYIERLLQDFEHSLQEKDFDRSEQSRRALTQAIDMCPDHDVFQRRFHLLDSHNAYYQGQFAAAIQSGRKAFLGAALASPHTTEEIFTLGVGYAIILSGEKHEREAVGVLSYVLSLTYGDPSIAEDEKAWAEFVLADLRIQSGEMQSNLSAFLDAYRRLSDRRRVNNRHLVAVHLIESGASVIESEIHGIETLDFPTPFNKSLQVLRILDYACLLENQEVLAVIVEKYATTIEALGPDRRHFQLLWAQFLLRAIDKPTKRLAAQFEKKVSSLPSSSLSDPMIRITAHMSCCQIALLVGDVERAQSEHQNARALFDALPSAVTPPIMVKAMHYKNVTKLTPRVKRSKRFRSELDEAQRFFRCNYDNGYAVFRSLV